MAWFGLASQRSEVFVGLFTISASHLAGAVASHGLLLIMNCKVKMTSMVIVVAQEQVLLLLLLLLLAAAAALAVAVAVAVAVVLVAGVVERSAATLVYGN